MYGRTSIPALLVLSCEFTHSNQHDEEVASIYHAYSLLLFSQLQAIYASTCGKTFCRVGHYLTPRKSLNSKRITRKLMRLDRLQVSTSPSSQADMSPKVMARPPHIASFLRHTFRSESSGPTASFELLTTFALSLRTRLTVLCRASYDGLRGIKIFDSSVQPCKYSQAMLFSLSRTLRGSERPFEVPSRVLQRTSSSFINDPPGSRYLVILTRDHDIPSPAPTASGKRTYLLSYLHSLYCRLLPKALISTKMVPVQPESIRRYYSVVGGNRAGLQNLLCLGHGMEQVAEQVSDKTQKRRLPEI
ncbi:uncharacterized protein F5891DRAFT_298760 [Suillus fuscotomentosus]|uniref:Uncharacterized protein n=1 Tax=Suillus fuscotomentosus TaxID=1912939 RepID=A0AAD4HL73_9AGAM|nr:uncharacterized protein F5891DRAFT_298760 [Suillus fuscotomentosus]KAG1900567.1 hypothetical protein F5891DRAFT_298760 [Suillus fuscotomentosus]